MEDYKTIQGDTWDGIAYKLYGQENLFPLLISANPTYARIVQFEAGVTLQIPPKPEELNDDLPPWKRGAV